jgi:lysozyme
MKRLTAILIGIFWLSTFEMTPSLGAISSTTFKLSQTPGMSKPIITLYGDIKPAKAGAKVVVQSEENGVWKDTKLSTKTVPVGTWQLIAVAENSNATMKYRAKVTMGGTTLISKPQIITLKPIRLTSTDITNSESPFPLIDLNGPGGRIHGADISRWQHPNDAPINFTKMYRAGIRFVMIKSSDTRDESDALSLKYLLMDRTAAQAAGIFTGFYHYATLPDATTKAQIIQDAQAQAQKVIWRLASVGGYTERDLPYALDLENNCVQYSGSTCTKYAPKDLVTLWAKTFLGFLKEKTLRTPILYSYPSFLETAMVRDEELRQYPLWLAQYEIDPADPLAQPGLKASGCYVHSWTSANCLSQWTVWQYTSCGIAKKYGVPGNRLDLNVFQGSRTTFLDLLQGQWVPEPTELMPTNEPTSLAITGLKFSNSDNPIVVNVDVYRPDGNPVVTGTVRFYANPLLPIPVTPIQSVIRSSSGSWKLTLKDVPPGNWTGFIGFKDATGTHEKTRTPIQFTISEGAAPAPSPTPTAKPTPSKKPVTDGCRYQIKN